MIRLIRLRQLGKLKQLGVEPVVEAETVKAVDQWTIQMRSSEFMATINYLVSHCPTAYLAQVPLYLALVLMGMPKHGGQMRSARGSPTCARLLMTLSSMMTP